MVLSPASANGLSVVARSECCWNNVKTTVELALSDGPLSNLMIREACDLTSEEIWIFARCISRLQDPDGTTIMQV